MTCWPATDAKTGQTPARETDAELERRIARGASGIEQTRARAAAGRLASSDGLRAESAAWRSRS